MVKNPPTNAGNKRDTGSIPGSGRYPGEGNDNPLLPGESHGWRSLAGYSPEGCKESDTTEGRFSAKCLPPKNYSLSLLTSINILKSQVCTFQDAKISVKNQFCRQARDKSMQSCKNRILNFSPRFA